MRQSSNNLQSTARQSSLDGIADDDELIKDEDQVALKEAANGLQQFDEVLRIAEGAISTQQFQLTPEMVKELNRIAVQNVRRSAGQFRTVPISITNTLHEPPPADEVPGHLTEMCNYVNQHWRKAGEDLQDAFHLAAYVMWRLNWIHPFRDGNGRTSRAVSYLVMTVRLGQILGGQPTIADQIVDNKDPYYQALDDADAAWKEGRLDLGSMENLLSRLLENQLGSQ